MTVETCVNTSFGWEDLVALVKGGLGVRVDSRAVNPGEVFVAVKGAAADGADFIAKAVERGAGYVVAENASRMPAGSAARLVVRPDTRQALGELAGAQNNTSPLGFPLLGVTGTNGKTTVTYLLEHILAAAGMRPGVVGTLEYRWPGHVETAVNTTPGCLTLHALLGRMAKAEAGAAVMEVSSHALDQDRVAGLAFDVAGLTNVTQDHLDYHQDMESYFSAKRRFFTTYLKSLAGAVINADDAYGRRLLGEMPDAMGYGLGDSGGKARFLRGRIQAATGQGLEMMMDYEGQTWQVASPLVGSFNAANLLTAQAMALALGLPVSALASLATCHGAPGRLERVPNRQGLNVFVDYAHTPDALENVLQVLRGLDFKRVIAVFGCGGDRDRAKRPLMAAAVAKWADMAVLTSDNPRSEDPKAIIADAMPGLATARQALAQADRRKAIEAALEQATPADAVLVAGKGHEDYQEICGVKHPFHDVLVVKEILGCA